MLTLGPVAAGCGGSAGVGGSSTAAGSDAGPALAARVRRRELLGEHRGLSSARARANSVHKHHRQPSLDPHRLPTHAGRRPRACDGSGLAIANGLGYDPWAPRLLAADPNGKRSYSTVGDVLGLAHGDNPHRWYAPADVERRERDHRRSEAARSCAARLLRRAARAVRRPGPRPLPRGDRADPRRYAGVPVGASESIVALQTPALGRPGHPYWAHEGGQRGHRSDRAGQIAAQGQIAGHQIRVWIFNSQNATPEVQRLNSLARAAGIPVVAITRR